MSLGFPEYLRFYESPVGGDVLNSITFGPDNKITIRYTRTHGFTIPADQKCYEGDLLQITDKQQQLLNHWKQQMKLEPSSNPDRYVNVLMIQQNLDEITFHRIGNGYSYDAIRETEDEFEVTYRIDCLYTRSRPKSSYTTTVTYPKWMLRQDQIDRLHSVCKDTLKY